MEQRKEIKHQMPDANVVMLSLANLSNAAGEQMTGDPVSCAGMFLQYIRSADS